MIIKFCKNLLRFLQGTPQNVAISVFVLNLKNKQCNPCINNDFLRYKIFLLYFMVETVGIY